jgi:hypothetical protein
MAHEQIDERATPVTIQFLAPYCRSMRHILEVGGGGGTITEMIVKESPAHIDTYEVLDFCIEELQKLPHDRVNIITDCKILPPRRAYDLVIIDGLKNPDFSRATLVSLMLDSLTSVPAVYIEGSRYDQRAVTLSTLSKRFGVRLTHNPGRRINGTYHKGGALITTFPSAFPFFHYLIARVWNLIDLHRLRKLKKRLLKRFS